MSCFVLTMVLPAMAYDTGVKSGDWIKYDVDFSVSITYPYSMSWSFKGTIKMTIQEVTSTTISGTIEVTGTTSGSIPTPPISPGSTPFSINRQDWTSSGMLFPLLIPSNLAVGQSIPGAYETVQAIVDWQGRKAVKAGYMGVEAYWDQATGALLEIKGSTSTGYGSATLSIKAADTNMFSLGLGWLLWVIIIVVVVVVVAVVAVILLRRRKPPTAPPSPVQPTPPPPPPPTQ
ncbi:MAG: hypothetical protein QXJ31_02880 [Candidatus Bathyarchaeia archaeon]